MSTLLGKLAVASQIPHSHCEGTGFCSSLVGVGELGVREKQSEGIELKSLD